jgi:hypothetical protein
MLSRYLVIAIALAVAVIRARDKAWVETAGVGALAVGLILLRVADSSNRPALKKIAWVFFAVTAVAMGIVFQRDYLR